MDMDKGWEGPDRRSMERRAPCNYPDCGAKTDADLKHLELRDDLKEIKKINSANGEKFERLARTMEKVSGLQTTVMRLETEHKADILAIRNELEKKVTYRELKTYGAIMVVAMGIIQFVIMYFKK
jgi:hypothetical protein